jgi:hypothetical protein
MGADPLADALRELVAAEVERQLAERLPPAGPPELLTIAAAARRLGRSRSWLYDRIRDGDVRSVALGMRTYLAADALADLARDAAPLEMPSGGPQGPAVGAAAGSRPGSRRAR